MDARSVIINGEPKGVIATNEGIVIIGTGSPAMLPKEIWEVFLAH
jgi:hypothetical protein